VAIADVYAAMTGTRTYRGSQGPLDVIRSLEADSSVLYDPKILIPLISNIALSYSDQVDFNIKIDNTSVPFFAAMEE